MILLLTNKPCLFVKCSILTQMTGGFHDEMNNFGPYFMCPFIVFIVFMIPTISASPLFTDFIYKCKIIWKNDFMYLSVQPQSPEHSNACDYLDPTEWLSWEHGLTSQPMRRLYHQSCTLIGRNSWPQGHAKEKSILGESSELWCSIYWQGKVTLHRSFTNVYLRWIPYTPDLMPPTLKNAPPPLQAPKLFFFPSRNWQNNIKSLFADFSQKVVPLGAFKRGYTVC